MSTHTTISLQNETLEVLEEIKSNEPDFNLSGFINNRLKEYLDEPDLTLSKEFLLKKINLMKSEINTLLKKIDMCHNKMIEIDVKKEMEQAEQELRLKKEKEKNDFQRKNIGDFFLEEVGREITEDEYQQYKEALDKEEVSSIFDFIEKRRINKEVIIQ